MDLINHKRSILLAYGAFLYGTFMLFTLISSYNSYLTDQWTFFYYYSNQTNILVTAWMLLYSYSVFRNNERFYNFLTKRIILVSLTVYMAIVYLLVVFILEPLFLGLWVPFGGVFAPYLHVTTPFMVWIYFFLVPGNGSLKAKQIAYLTIYPALFLVSNLIIGATVRYEDGTAAYAYDFINPNTYPNIFVFIVVIIGLAAFFSLFGLGILRFKKYLLKAYYNFDK
jgi:hypothetical protein